MNKLSEILKKAALEYQKEKSEEISKIHEHLEKEGVPLHLGKRLREIIHTHHDKDAKTVLGSAIKEAIDKKREGKISENGLRTIVEETINEHEKGIPKDELKDLIKEILESELKKGELLSMYQQKQSFEQAQSVEGIKGSGALPMPMPSIEEGGAMRRKYTGTGKEWAEQKSEPINITYPLLFKDGKVHVYANIRYDPASNSLLYKVIEPTLTEEEQQILKKIETTLVDELEVDFSALKEETAEKYLSNKVDNVIEYYRIMISERTRYLIDYFINRDFIGLGKIEPLMLDPNLEDISCDGINIPIYVYHRDARLGSLKTNIVFSNEDELNSFVMKVAQRCGRAISVADPLLDGALPDGSRVQATFGSGISMKGSNFTIRKFTKDPLTFIDILNYGTMNEEILAYLWLAIEHGKSVLVSGPTASGKTTMLNALSLFIRPEMKIVSIEDTPELRLPHENWISQVARMGFGPETTAGKKLGEISLFDLLKASLRQRPDIIIVGEVRGKEAYVLFQQMATGHPGMSTIHAESMQGVINRLRTPPINLPPSLTQHLDIVVILTRQRVKGKYLRRSKEIFEVLGYDTDKDKPLLNEVYTWKIISDKYVYSGKSAVLREIMERIGTTPEGIYLEVERRMKVIKWMQENGIRDFKNVGRILSEYYQNPEKLLEKLT